MLERPTQTQQRAYLLGKASSAEAEEVEEVLFGDPQAHEALRALEDDIAQEYLDGRLTTQERQAFEARMRTDERLATAVAVIARLNQWAASLPDAPPARRRVWFRAITSAAAFACAGALAVAVVGLPESTVPDEFGAKGGAEAFFRPRCAPTCVSGAQLAFELKRPPTHPYVALFGQRADGRIVWYAPEAGRFSAQAPAATDVWGRSFTLDDAHPVGPLTLYAFFSKVPMTRAQIAEAMGDDLQAGPAYIVERREVVIEAQP